MPLWRRPKAEKVAEGVYVVGGPGYSSYEDCLVYAVDCGSAVALIDCGAGKSVRRIEENMRSVELDPSCLKALILTHLHIDHVGGARHFREEYGARVYMHELDAPVLEQGDQVRSAAYAYGISLKPCVVDVKLRGSRGEIRVGNRVFEWIHTPGHTPGSISLVLSIGGEKVLFAQDAHGPFSEEWGSDISQWAESMRKLISLDFTVLAEGHYGVYRREEGIQYLRDLLRQYGFSAP